MHHMNRRGFLQNSLALAAGAAGAVAAGAAASSGLAQQRREKLPVAAIVTTYHTNSHADVIIGKILEGFDQNGGAGPDLRLVSMFTDQVHKNDLSRDLAKKHDFRITESIEEALTLGTGKLAVRGVLSIGEHGDYPYTKDTRQHEYPRRRFFDAITAVFRKTGQVVPVFNDKHLAYNWADAKHMYDVAQELKIPFMAGSSVPVAWRSPALALPMGCALTEALAVGYGGLESYGFHALETLQCMVERRKGAETGIAAVQAVSGEEIARAEKMGRWSRELLDAAIAPTPEPPKGRARDFGKNTVFFLIEYRDGLKAAVAMSTGQAFAFSFAGKLQDQDRPAATHMRLQENRPFGHFAHLLRAIEHMIHTGRPAYPVERTLLTTGALDALMHSHADGGRRRATPELAIRYEPVDWAYAAGAP